LSQQLNDDLNQPADGTPELRVNPIQRRAKDQLERILSSAAEIADEVGADYLTTAAVATRSGCSIGTVYRSIISAGMSRPATSTQCWRTWTICPPDPRLGHLRHRQQ
jgi:hypothetical protein